MSIEQFLKLKIQIEEIILIQDCYDDRLYTPTIYNTELISSIFIFQVLEMADDL